MDLSGKNVIFPKDRERSNQLIDRPKKTTRQDLETLPFFHPILGSEDLNHSYGQIISLSTPTAPNSLLFSFNFKDFLCHVFVEWCHSSTNADSPPPKAYIFAAGLLTSKSNK